MPDWLAYAVIFLGYAVCVMSATVLIVSAIVALIWTADDRRARKEYDEWIGQNGGASSSLRRRHSWSAFS